MANWYLFSQLFDTKMLMILGSDDMVSEDYMSAYKSIFIDKFDFCYNKSWLTYNSSDGYLFCQNIPVLHIHIR